VRSAVASGADVVAFSGDKLLGGPQAGVLVGRREAIARVKRHPLCRALRVDKLTVAALEATLELYRDGRAEEIPTRALIAQAPERLRERADRLAALLSARGARVRVEPSIGQVGGGAMPLARLPSFACVLTVEGPEAFLEALRGAELPVIGRISDGAVLLDVRCLAEEELGPVADAVGSALQGRRP
jgi:L-seryl-tRNA(Ser) seleniumtransferase